MLIFDTIRARRAATLVWVTGGSVFMYVIALGYVREVDQSPSGAPGMGAALEAAAQAMRLLRWPAERLDTFGGYITYHNVTMLALLLGLWAAVQGARTLRGTHVEGPLEEILATGWSRGRVIIDRVAGFVVTLAVITFGIGLGLAAATAVAGVYDFGGSMVTVASAGLGALACFALGLAAAQFVATERAAAGMASSVIIGLYLLTNVWEELGGLGTVRFVSPFYYFNQSRALVPGQSASLPAMGVLIGMAAMMTGLSAWAFERRDISSPLWARKRRLRLTGIAGVEPGDIRPYWRAECARQRMGLLGWSAGMAMLMGLMAWLEPVVIKFWEELGFTEFMIAAGSEASVTDQYISFTAELVAAVVIGFVVAQAAVWVAEMRDGRVELYLAHPVSWRKLVLERLGAMTVGVIAIALGAVVGLSIGAAVADVPLGAIGLLRTALDTVLLGLAIGGLGAVLVAWLPTVLSVTWLAVTGAGSYLLAFAVPLFDLPEWLTNLSFFGAYGHPYLEIPDAIGLVFLIGLAAAGAWLAPIVANRLPKV